MDQTPRYPTLAEATRVWARIAALSFGGPAGQIAVMHRILVKEKRWIGDERFLHALNFCMLLPGPEAQQLATYIGWLMHGVRGALVAGILFILPGVVAIMALSWIYVIFGDATLVDGLFFGLKAAVLAIVLQAVQRVAKRALRNNAMRVIAALSFVGLFFFHLPFPLIVALAALTGFVGERVMPAVFAGGSGHGAIAGKHVDDHLTLLGAETVGMGPAVRAGAFRAGFAALVLWLLPVGLLLVFAPGSVFTNIAAFFSKLAVLTFGGAYAVLAWVAQDAVGVYGWLEPGQMVDGLGMAETTPGPLIMVLQFVGFMGAYKAGGLAAATLGGLLATWVTFAPCFAWIFFGAPFMEGLRKNTAIKAALTAVTAAVVGVILNLAIWFGMHVIFTGTHRIDAGLLNVELPVLSSFDPVAFTVVFGALIGVFVSKAGTAKVLAVCGLAGIVLAMIGLA